VSYFTRGFWNIKRVGLKIGPDGGFGLATTPILNVGYVALNQIKNQRVKIKNKASPAARQFIPGAEAGAAIYYIE
jgi:hypothetical protein